MIEYNNIEWRSPEWEKFHEVWTYGSIILDKFTEEGRDIWVDYDGKFWLLELRKGEYYRLTACDKEGEE